jgi:hypothetical protein
MSLEIPTTVPKMNDLSSCVALTQIQIPSSVSIFEELAFEECQALADV